MRAYTAPFAQAADMCTRYSHKRRFMPECPLLIQVELRTSCLYSPVPNGATAEGLETPRIEDLQGLYRINLLQTVVAKLTRDLFMSRPVLN